MRTPRHWIERISSLVSPRRLRTKLLFTAANDDFEARSVSALRVPPDHEAMLFEQPDGTGFALVLLCFFLFITSKDIGDKIRPGGPPDKYIFQKDGA